MSPADESDPDFAEVDEMPPEPRTLVARQVLPGVTAAVMIDNHRVALVFECESYAASDALFSYLAEEIESGKLKLLEDIP